MHERQEKLVGETVHYQLRQAERGHLTCAESAQRAEFARNQLSAAGRNAGTWPRRSRAPRFFNSCSRLAAGHDLRAERLDRRDVGDETVRIENSASTRITHSRMPSANDVAQGTTPQQGRRGRGRHSEGSSSPSVSRRTQTTEVDSGRAESPYERPLPSYGDIAPKQPPIKKPEYQASAATKAGWPTWSQHETNAPISAPKTIPRTCRTYAERASTPAAESTAPRNCHEFLDRNFFSAAAWPSWRQWSWAAPAIALRVVKADDAAPAADEKESSPRERSALDDELLKDLGPIRWPRNSKAKCPRMSRVKRKAIPKSRMRAANRSIRNCSKGSAKGKTWARRSLRAIRSAA